MQRSATKWLTSSTALGSIIRPSLLLNKVFIGDLFQLTCYTGCYGMNNAKGCFDYIEHTFAILVLMYYRVSWSIVISLFMFFRRYGTKTKLCTAFQS